MVETIFDTLNAKAAIAAITEIFEKSGADVPLIISGTVTDLSGRILSGQTVEAFLISIAHAQAAGRGLELRSRTRRWDRTSKNWPTGASATRAPIRTPACLIRSRPPVFRRHRNLGAAAAKWARNGWLNIVGGCCGTTPDHIRAIAEAVRIARRGAATWEAASAPMADDRGSGREGPSHMRYQDSSP